MSIAQRGEGMKKITALLLAGVMIFVCADTAFAREINVVVDGKTVTFTDAKPYVDKNGRTYAPLRYMVQSFGFDVGWDKETFTVSAIKYRLQ